MKKASLIIFVFCCIAENIVQAQCQRPNTKYDSTCKVQAIGHRGYRHLYPENTLLGLEEAFKRGVKFCEVDIAVTKDSEYVIFHDAHYGIDRTTTGQGYFYDKTLAELQNFDAGVYKGYYFKGQAAPKLEEAIVLAEKYDAHLYLDTKDYHPDIMKEELIESGAAPDRIWSAIEGGLGNGKNFHKILPKTPWVLYNGGDYPDSILDDNYLSELYNTGCRAVEINIFISGDSMWSAFEKKVHNHGLQIWAFPSAMNNFMDTAAKYHIDKVESDRAWGNDQYYCEGLNATYPDSLTTANWRFNNTLLGLGIGSQLATYNFRNPPYNQKPVLSSCSDFGISNLDGVDANVALIPNQTNGNGILVYTDFSIEEDGSLDHTYSIIMDFLIHDSSVGRWASLISTSFPPGSYDGDVFINNKGGIGIQGDYDGKVTTNIWHRLVLVFNRPKKKFYKYMDGVYLGKNDMFGTRWSVYNSTPNGQKHGFLLFSDNDGETVPVYLSALQVRDYPIDSLNAIKLGKPSVNGIPMGNADLYNVKISGHIPDSTIMDYDRQQYYIVVPPSVNLKKAYLTFDPSYGAKTSISNSSYLDLSSGSKDIVITSEDKSRTKTWHLCIKQATYSPIEEESKSAQFSMYPNPAANSLTIKHSFAQESFYFIHDITGREVMKGNAHTTSIDIDISALDKGVYLVWLQSGEDRVVKKLIKE